MDHILVGHLVGFRGNAAIGVAWQIFLVVIIFINSLFVGMSVLVVGLFIQLLVWAAFGFGIYLVIKILSPSTAGKIREVVTGKP